MSNKSIGGIGATSKSSSNDPKDNFINTAKKVLGRILREIKSSGKKEIREALHNALKTDQQCKALLAKVEEADVSSQLQEYLNGRIVELGKKDNPKLKGIKIVQEDIGKILYGESFINPRLVGPAFVLGTSVGAETSANAASSVPQAATTLHRVQSEFYSGPTIEISRTSDLQKLLGEHIGEYFIREVIYPVTAFTLVKLKNFNSDKVFFTTSTGSRDDLGEFVEQTSKERFSRLHPVPVDKANSGLVDTILKVNSHRCFDGAIDSEYIDGKLIRGTGLKPERQYTAVCIRNSNSDLIGDRWTNKSNPVIETRFDAGNRFPQDIGFNGFKRHFVFIDITDEIAASRAKFQKGREVLNKDPAEILKDLGFREFDPIYDTEIDQTSLSRGPQPDKAGRYDLVLVKDFLKPGNSAKVLYRDIYYRGVNDFGNLYIYDPNPSQQEMQTVDMNYKLLMLIRQDKPAT